MIELSKEDKLFFFERNFVTLDGLWMLETENECGWDRALKVDVNVWINLFKTILRRFQRYLNIKTNTLYDLIKILMFRWSIEGWEFEIQKKSDNELHLEVVTCPYKEAMKRNPERHHVIPKICTGMCHVFYKEVFEDFNSDLTFEVTRSQGLGADTCDFKFVVKNDNSLSQNGFVKPNITLDDRLFYYEKNFFTMDGWWMVEVENELGEELALKIDTIVWQRLYKIIFRRVKRYLNITGSTIQDLIKILEFTWSCEGFDYKVIKNEMDEGIMHMTYCPYNAMMERNPERHHRIEAICKDMCIPFYVPALEEFNPNIEYKRTKFLGVGDDVCDYHFKLKGD